VKQTTVIRATQVWLLIAAQSGPAYNDSDPYVKIGLCP